MKKPEKKINKKYSSPTAEFEALGAHGQEVLVARTEELSRVSEALIKASKQQDPFAYMVEYVERRTVELMVSVGINPKEFYEEIIEERDGK